MKMVTFDSQVVEEKRKLGEKLYLSDSIELKKYDVNYLSNTVFDKSITGIGGTHYFLNCNDHIIILLPFVNIVDNKSKDGILSVKQGVTEADIASYLETAKVRKIISTFDGLKKLTRGYNQAGLNIYQDFLLIDEWQILLNQYGLRRDAIRRVLLESEQFKNRCFMTATPHKKEYWFKEMKGLQEVKLDLQPDPINLYYFKANSIIDEAVEIIMNLDENRNLHIFINSVLTIESILNRLNIPREFVRIICSDTEENKKKLPPEYSIESITSPIKRINFYTSTAFEGCDIFDKNGKIVVLSDGGKYKEHTLIDLKGTLRQIAGRIRDIEDQSVTLIYSETNKVYTDLKEQIESKNTEKIKAQVIAKKANDPLLKDLFNTRVMNEHYIFRDNGQYVVDEVYFNIDLIDLEVRKSYNYDVDITNIIPTFFIPIKIDKPLAMKTKILNKDKIKKMSFKEECIAYNETQNCSFSFTNCFDPIAVRAVNILSIETLEEMEFHKGNIKKALIGKLDTTEQMKMIKLLDLKDGSFYASNELLEKMQKACNYLEIAPIRSATYIENLYEVKGGKSMTKTIKGKKTRGYIIVGEKSIFSKC